MLTNCPVCKNESATIDPALGVLPGKKCKDRRTDESLRPTIEFTSEQIKEDRKRFASDIIQPFRGGEVSKEYIEKYGTKGIEVTKDEAKKAVNTTDSYYG